MNFLKKIQILNTGQRQIFDHVMKDVITERKSPHLFITGGAGVGKTLLLHILYNSLSRHYNVLLNANPDQKKKKKKTCSQNSFCRKSSISNFWKFDTFNIRNKR